MMRYFLILKSKVFQTRHSRVFWLAMLKSTNMVFKVTMDTVSGTYLSGTLPRALPSKHKVIPFLISTFMTDFMLIYFIPDLNK